jgi:hypothetical protein
MNLKASRTLRVAVLECDTPLPQTKEKYKGYGGVFEVLLRSGARAVGDQSFASLDFSFWQVELHPDKYPKPSEIDAILITGSRK